MDRAKVFWWVEVVTIVASSATLVGGAAHGLTTIQFQDEKIAFLNEQINQCNVLKATLQRKTVGKNTQIVE